MLFLLVSYPNTQYSLDSQLIVIQLVKKFPVFLNGRRAQQIRSFPILFGNVSIASLFCNYVKNPKTYTESTKDIKYNICFILL
jgi:hypothetical protein